MTLWQRLIPLYEAGEARAIVRLLLEDVFNLSLSDIICGGVEQLSADDQEKLERMMQRLEQGEPVQYVTGKAVFCGRTFHVEPGVLIPRPETEELVRWMMEDVSGGEQRILDVGTGSGCIAISIAKELENADVEAWDISEDALRIASENACMLDARVRFVKQDVLAQSSTTIYPSTFTTIISNPPYICQKEKANMARNVLDYEPNIALFVPDDSPLLFYDAIAECASHALVDGGRLYFEINPLYASDTEVMLTGMGFHDIDIRTDEFGKKRMIRAQIR